MLLTDYQAGARTTAFYPADRGIDYTAHGLTSEGGEIAEKMADLLTRWTWLTRDMGAVPTGTEAAEVMTGEIGDVLWYVALSAHEQGQTLDYDLAAPAELLAGDTPVITAFRTIAATGYYAGRVKKRLRDGHDAISDDVIHTALVTILDTLKVFAATLGINLADAAQTNLDKLASRAARNTLGGDGDNR